MHGGTDPDGKERDEVLVVIRQAGRARAAAREEGIPPLRSFFPSLERKRWRQREGRVTLLVSITSPSPPRWLVLSPGTCVRCNCALPAQSVGLFCPICQPANETAPPSPATPEKSPVPAPAELPTESYQPAGIANSSTRTDPFAQGVVQVAQASEPGISVKATHGRTAVPDRDGVRGDGAGASAVCTAGV